MPRRDVGGMPIQHQTYDLDRWHLQRALAYAANYLRSQGADVLIIAVGGAVNTILLQSRNVTHDVDFFMSPNRPQLARLLDEAARSAEMQSSVPLGGDWLNNSTALYLSKELRIELSEEAIAQNAIVFQRQGLTVLAAPWMYACCAKIERLGNPSQRRSYDAADAATYLRKFLQFNRLSAARYQSLVDHALRYRTSISVDVCQRVNDQYRGLYNADGIVFE